MFDRIQASDRKHVYTNTLFCWLFYEINTFKPKPYANGIWNVYCDMDKQEISFWGHSVDFYGPMLTGEILRI
jgi:hypothetical protein